MSLNIYVYVSMSLMKILRLVFDINSGEWRTMKNRELSVKKTTITTITITIYKRTKTRYGYNAQTHLDVLKLSMTFRCLEALHDNHIFKKMIKY